MKGITCPKCGIDDHDPKAELDGLYVCAQCGGIIAYLCRGCDKVYFNNRLGRRGDEWHCKECDVIQWGYTDYKRKQLGLPE